MDKGFFEKAIFLNGSGVSAFPGPGKENVREVDINGKQ